MMTRLIVTGACALFLIGCSKKAETPSAPGTHAPAAAATETTMKFQIGEEL